MQLQSEKKAEEEEAALKEELKELKEELESARLDRATQTAFNKHLVVAGSCNYIFYVEKKVTHWDHRTRRENAATFFPRRI